MGLGSSVVVDSAGSMGAESISYGTANNTASATANNTAGFPWPRRTRTAPRWSSPHPPHGLATVARPRVHRDRTAAVVVARNGRGLVARLRARPSVWQAARATQGSPIRQREVLVSRTGSKIPLAAGEAGDATNEGTGAQRSPGGRRSDVGATESVGEACAQCGRVGLKGPGAFPSCRNPRIVLNQ
jgi:hypothetical protein